MEIKHTVGPRLARGLLAPETYNEDENSIVVVFATEEPVRRWDWDLGEFDEILDVTPESMRTDRLTAGAPALANHNSWSLESILGVTVDHWFEGKKGLAKIKFSERDDVKEIIKDIKAGIIRNVSVGYRVHKFNNESTDKDAIKILRAVDWEPYEISFVPVPADKDSQVRSAVEKNECLIISKGEALKGKRAEETETETEAAESTESTTTAEAAVTTTEVTENAEGEKKVEVTITVDLKEEENERCLEIIDSCRKHNLGPEFERTLLASKENISEVRKQIINKIAEGKRAMSTNTNVTIVADEKDKKRELVQSALAVRMGLAKPADEEVRNLRHHSLIEMAKLLDPSLRSLSKTALAKRAMHASGDFPALFENLTGMILAKQAEAAPRSFESFCNVVNLPDYKAVKKLDTSLAMSLKKVAEGGEYEFGTFGENSETYYLSKFGRKIRFTEEMFINDSMGELETFPKRFLAISRSLESQIVYAILTGSHKMGDGGELFQTALKNLGTPAAITEASLSEVYEQMMSQEVDGNILNIMPKSLIVGPKNRTAAKKILTSLTAVGKSGDVNVFENDLDLIVDGNIRGKEWFVAAEKKQVETIDTAYLDGQSEPEVVAIPDPENDAITIKCKHVFAAKAVSRKGLYKNAGV